MDVTGVPAEGKRISLGYGLSIHLPYGAVYAKSADDENNVMIRMLSPIPGNYRAGRFSIDDEDTPLWSLGSFRRQATVDYSEYGEDEALEELAKSLGQISQSLAKGSDTAVTEEDKRKDTLREDDDGTVTFTSSLSIGFTGGGKVGTPVKASDKVVYCTAEQNLRIGRAGNITYRHLLVGTVDYPGGDLRMAFLSVSNEDKMAEILERRIAPVLKTLELDYTQMGVEIKEPARTPEEKAQREAERQERAEAERQEEEARKKAEEARKKAELEAEKKRAEAAKARAEKARAQQGEIDQKYQQKLDEVDRRLEAAQRAADAQEEKVAALWWEVYAQGLFGKKKKDDLKAKQAEQERELERLRNVLQPLQNERLQVIKDHKNERRKNLQVGAAYIDPSRGGSASSTALEIAKRIVDVIDVEPKTVQDLNDELRTSYTSLQIANTIKMLAGVSSTKVMRRSVNAKGLMTEKEYTAYCLEGSGNITELRSKTKSGQEQKQQQYDAALHRCKAAKGPVEMRTAAKALADLGEYQNALAQSQQYIAFASNAEKQRKKGGRLIAIAVLLVIIAVVATPRIVHQIRYSQAEALIAAGDFDGAIAMFTELKERGGVEKATFQKGLFLFAAEDFDGALEVFQSFKYPSLVEGEYQGELHNARDMTKIVKEEKAQAERQKEADDKLAEAEAKTAAAEAFLAKGAYDDAVEMFEEAYDLELAAQAILAKGTGDKSTPKPSAPDAADGDDGDDEPVDIPRAERARQARYQQGEALIADGKFDAAVMAFKMAGDYGDAEMRVQKTCYQKGETLLGTGDYAGAAEAFIAAGEFEDAAVRMQEAYYRLAEELALAEDYVRAAAAYMLALDYQDAEEKAYETMELFFASGTLDGIYWRRDSASLQEYIEISGTDISWFRKLKSLRPLSAESALDVFKDSSVGKIKAGSGQLAAEVPGVLAFQQNALSSYAFFELGENGSIILWNAPYSGISEGEYKKIA